MTEAEVWFTGLAQSSSGVLPTLLLVRFAQCLDFQRFFSFRKPTQRAPPSPPATIFPPNWSRVPQRNYGGKRWNLKRLEPISFSMNGRPGINMGAALRKIYAGLDGRDDPVLQGASGAISCRLLVGLLQFSVRPPIRLLELTASQVPGVSGQHQFTPGTSAE
jgi:hypothetical protein